jgi:hypothetical protein
MLPLNIAGITIGPTAATPTTTAVALNSLPKSPIFSPPFFHIIMISSPLKTALKIDINTNKSSTIGRPRTIQSSPKTGRKPTVAAKLTNITVAAAVDATSFQSNSIIPE